MDYRRFDNTIVARIDKGEEILEQIKEIALKENIKLASVRALGATNEFTVGVFKVDEKKYYSNEEFIIYLHSFFTPPSRRIGTKCEMGGLATLGRPE